MIRFRDFASFGALAALIAGGHTANAKAGQDLPGLAFWMMEVDPAPVVAAPVSTAEPLTPQETATVLARLPALPRDTGAGDGSVLRDPPRPPPRSGVTVRSPFPSAERRAPPDPTAAEPLTVVSRRPEGEVGRGVQIAVGFSQAMVAVSSRGEVSERDLPVRMTPQPPGRWRWIGTRTLVFQPDPGLPMATPFVVEVPAGASAMGGGTLPETVRWEFATSRPEVAGLLPYRYPGLERHPTFVALFDQDVDADSVLARLSVRAGDSVFEVRQATTQELEAVVTGYSAARVKAARRVAFRTVRPLPWDAKVDIAFGAGIPSAEGPLRTDTVQRLDRRTYGPLRVVDWHCGQGSKICSPGQPWYIRLSNDLDATAFADSLVRVEPALEHANIRAVGPLIVVSGASEPRTIYRVKLDPRTTDTFGQRLGGPDTVTVEVGPAPATLSAVGGSFAVLDPGGSVAHTVRTVNVDSLRVRVYRVAPEEWPTFVERERNLRQRHRVDTEPPGALVISKTLAVGGQPDIATETSIDLGPALPDGLGQAVLVVEGTSPSRARFLRPVYTWIQGTRIALSAFADRHGVVAWATDLETGSPLGDVAVRVLPGQAGGGTDGDGLARIPLRMPEQRVARFVVARRNDDIALLPLPVADPDSTTGALRWHVLTDRPLYRPEEEVHAKGWVRLEDDGPLPELALPGNEVGQVIWRVEDRVGAELANGRAEVGPRGEFDLAFTVPAFADAGQVALEVTADAPANRGGLTHRHALRVEAFRRPDFEVDLTKDADEAIVGGTAEVRVAARYFAGGALRDASVRWMAAAWPASYRPPDREGYRFGAWGDVEPAAPRTLTGSADGEGRHAVRLEFDEADPAVPMRLEVSATVSDVNRQAWTESTEILVHPSEVYVGLRTERRFVRRGEPLTVEAIAVDRDGAGVSGRPLDVTAVRVEWARVDGEWQRRERDRRECRRVSATGPVRCAFGPGPAGLHIVRAETTDDAGRPTLTELPVRVGGGRWLRGPDAETAGGVALLADRDDYQPGDTAEILIQSPFESAEGVWTLRGAGIARADPFRVDGPSSVLRLPITAAHMPNVRVHVNLIGTGGAAGEAASGAVDLSVPPLSRTLAVRADPREARIHPGEATTIDLEVRDAVGRPAEGAEVAVVVVDEAVWALAGDSVANPVESFYPLRRAVTWERDLRSSVLRRRGRGNAVTGAVFDAETGLPLEGAQIQLEGTSGGTLTGADGRYEITAPGAGQYTVVAHFIGYDPARQDVRVDAVEGAIVDFQMRTSAIQLDHFAVQAVTIRGVGAQDAIALRADFDALAAFVPTVVVDEDGRAAVPVRVPENLTRYRVIAVAAHGAGAFGKGESSLTVSLPVMARPSPPRFLRRGDRFELPVVVQNTLDSAITARVAVRGANVDWRGPRGFRVTLPPRGRAEVRFPASTRLAGPAVFQAAAVTGPETDAAELALTVHTPATVQAFASYGQVERGVEAVPVVAPRDVLPDVGGLEVTATSTALSELTDAFLYLRSYPYECAEQISSRVLATVALRDALSAFHAAGLPDPQALQDSVRQDVRRLELLQNHDGGFSLWGPGYLSWPFVTAHVAHALARARDAGYPVRPDVLERSRAYLGQMERVVRAPWSVDARQTILAYMLHVRVLLGEPDPAGAARVLGYQRIEDAPLEALAWMLPVLAEDSARGEPAGAIRGQILDRATETAGAAHFITGYDEHDYLTMRSSRRTDAVVLETLLRYEPGNALNAKLVRGLLGHRTRGRWANTQENVFVLLALARYFDALERTSPDFTARLWLGERFAGEGKFVGHSADRLAVDIPMSRLIEGEPRRDLLIQKDGTGRLYYRVGMRYAPAKLDAPPANEGFALERAYESVDDPADVVHEDDGSWTVQAGARVRVRVTLAAEGRRTHVALVDPLPAGLEPLNPELQGSGATVPGRPTPEVVGWRRVWFEHQNLHDDRAEAFTSLLYGGVYTYSYLARATTPGEYVVPPPRAEEMYHPETFGRGSRDRVRVQ